VSYVAEWVCLDHVKHGVDYFGFQQHTNQLFTVDDFIYGRKEDLQELNRANSVHSNFENGLVSLIDITSITMLS